MVTWVKCKPEAAYVVATGQKVTLMKFDDEPADMAGNLFRQVIVRAAGNVLETYFAGQLTPATHEASVLMASVKAKHTRVARLQEELEVIRKELKMPPLTGEYLKGLGK